MGRGGGSGGRSSGGSFGGSRSSGGRSGGSFGGGRSGGSSGGGFFGGGRSGGSSGGGFFGGGRSSGPSGGSMGGGGFNRGPIFIPFGGGGFNRGGRPGGCGCSPFFIVLIVIVLIALFLIYGMGTVNNSSNSSGEITKSTVQRVPLPKGSVNETEYYTDELGWISNKTELLTGLKNFYQKTGVQPYLYITDTVNGSHTPTTSELDDFANNLYGQLFTDEAHLLFVFFEYNNSYMDRYVCGTQAKTVIDTEAADILLDYVDRYYYDNSLSEDTFFSKSFSDAADRIMTVTRSPWIPVLIIFGVVILAGGLFFWWSNVKKQKNLEAQQTEAMLKTPLEKFGTDEAEDLTKKYEDTTKKDEDPTKKDEGPGPEVK